MDIAIWALAGMTWLSISGLACLVVSQIVRVIWHSRNERDLIDTLGAMMAIASIVAILIFSLVLIPIWLLNGAPGMPESDPWIG